MEKPFMSAKELAQLMSVSKSFLRGLRETEEWIEGIHWVYLNPSNPTSGIRFNTDLCLHWLATRSTPQEHQAAIEQYLATLSRAPQVCSQ